MPSVPQLQEAVAKRFDDVFNTRYNELADEMVRQLNHIRYTCTLLVRY